MAPNPRQGEFWLTRTTDSFHPATSLICLSKTFCPSHGTRTPTTTLVRRYAITETCFVYNIARGRWVELQMSYFAISWAKVLFYGTRMKTVQLVLESTRKKRLLAYGTKGFPSAYQPVAAVKLAIQQVSTYT